MCSTDSKSLLNLFKDTLINCHYVNLVCHCEGVARRNPYPTSPLAHTDVTVLRCFQKLRFNQRFLKGNPKNFFPQQRLIKRAALQKACSNPSPAFPLAKKLQNLPYNSSDSSNNGTFFNFSKPKETLINCHCEYPFLQSEGKERSKAPPAFPLANKLQNLPYNKSDNNTYNFAKAKSIARSKAPPTLSLAKKLQNLPYELQNLPYNKSNNKSDSNKSDNSDNGTFFNFSKPKSTFNFLRTPSLESLKVLASCFAGFQKKLFTFAREAKKVFLLPLLLISFAACSHKSDETKLLESQLATLMQMKAQAQKGQKLPAVKLFALNSKLASTLIALGREDEAILFLEEVVSSDNLNPNAPYYLLMIAFSYMRQNSAPLAEYYFERALQNHDDLLIKGQSIHYICLQNLIKISQNPNLRIKYLKELATKYAKREKVTELHLRIALEYEKLNEWEKALAEYEVFLKQGDSASIQIMDEPNAYKKARQLVGYSKSSRDWTFSSLDELKKTIQTAIRKYDWRTLDKCKAKVNFFSMSWKQDENDPNAQEEFSMRGFMRGQRINFENNFDKDSNAFEAYLRTWGWSQYVSVWYFYFRKVNYPVDPNINGNWEWAGIYMGEKL